MKRAAQLLRRFEFHVLLFFLGVAAFAKPTLIPNPSARVTDFLLAYFLPWALLIVVLWAIARSGPERDDADDVVEPGITTSPPPRD